MSGILLTTLFFIFGVFLYFIPCFVASARNTKNGAGIFLLNFFLGWSGLGWLGALIWAVCAEKKEG